MTLAALLFDVDGTLADTERDGHRIAFNQAFAAAGLDWDWSVDLYGALLTITGGKERMRHYLQHYRPEHPPVADSVIAALHKAKTAYYTQLLAQGRIPLRPGVARLLHEARAAGLRLAIATTTTPENVTALLIHALGPESLSWFEVIAAGDIVPAKKPAPDIYHYALAQMQLDPAHCLAFEDSANGIQAAAGANLATIVTVNAYTADHDFSSALTVLSDLGEPQAPARHLGGQALFQPWVDVATLRAWHAGLKPSGK